MSQKCPQILSRKYGHLPVKKKQTKQQNHLQKPLHIHITHSSRRSAFHGRRSTRRKRIPVRHRGVVRRLRDPHRRRCSPVTGRGGGVPRVINHTHIPDPRCSGHSVSASDEPICLLTSITSAPRHDTRAAASQPARARPHALLKPLKYTQSIEL